MALPHRCVRGVEAAGVVVMAESVLSDGPDFRLGGACKVVWPDDGGRAGAGCS